MFKPITSRLLLALALGLIAIFAVQVVVRMQFELPELFKLESIGDGNSIGRARRSIQGRVERLESIAEDYGAWNDAYAFAALKPSEPGFHAFVNSNLIPSTLATYHINGMMYLDPAGRVIYRISHGPETPAGSSQGPLLPGSLPHEIFEGRQPGPEHPDIVRSGIARSNIGPIVFAVSRVVPSANPATPRGNVLIWRAINRQFVRELNNEVGVDLSFIPIRQVQNDPALLQKLISIRNSKSGFLWRDGEQMLYWKIDDFRGSPVFLVRQPAGPRAFNASPISRSLIVAFAASGLFLVLVALYFSRRVITRIKSAERIMGRITSSGDYSARLPLQGDDELDRMFKQFNNMFAFIQDREDDLVKINKRLEELSQIDAVTGIANRRCLDETLDRCWRQAARTGRSISVLLIDIDYFKLFNDSYGHQKGDEALRRVAGALQDNLHRATDYVGRYGGEEFCVVLTDTEPDAALTVAESLLHAVRNLGILHEKSSCARCLTVSIGVASLAAAANVIQMDLIREADRALYQAKRDGRNMIRSAEEPPEAGQDFA